MTFTVDRALNIDLMLILTTATTIILLSRRRRRREREREREREEEERINKCERNTKQGQSLYGGNELAALT